MRIWIDLANSPQVLFFRPIISELRRRGHDLFITTRDFAQTVQLADQMGLPHTVIGSHGGRRLVRIVGHTFTRAWKLRCFVRGQGVQLAVGHNVYSQALAAAALRLPLVTLMDYEHQPANHLCFRLARRVIVPEPFPDEALRKYGASRGKVARYSGVKEEVYLSDFVPQPDYLDSVGVPKDKIIVVMRPPGPWGLYHRFENPLFDKVLDHIALHQDTHIVFLPRVAFQAEAVRGRGYANVWIPPAALDGPNLLYHADLAVSGGGTMNREAAVLGTPAYTVFKGQLGAVDRYLIQRDRMVQVSESEDIGRIRVEKRHGHARGMCEPTLVQKVTDMILEGV